MDEAELLSLAASGDPEAQHALAVHSINCGSAGVCPPVEAEVAAEMFARLASSSGQPRHRIMLAGVLLVRARSVGNAGDTQRCANFQQEAVAVLEGLTAEGNRAAASHLAALLSTLADEGDEEAAAKLNNLSDLMGPKLMAEAVSIERLCREIVGE